MSDETSDVATTGLMVFKCPRCGKQSAPSQSIDEPDIVTIMELCAACWPVMQMDNRRPVMPNPSFISLAECVKDGGDLWTPGAPPRTQEEE